MFQVSMFIGIIIREHVLVINKHK